MNEIDSFDKQNNSSEAVPLPSIKNAFLLFILMVLILFAAYKYENEIIYTVRDGYLVSLIMTVEDENGNVMYSTLDQSNPLPYTIFLVNTSSDDKLTAFISKNLLGMKKSEQKIIEITKEMGLFGTYDPQAKATSNITWVEPLYFNATEEELRAEGIDKIELDSTFATARGTKVTIVGIHEDGNITLQNILIPGQVINTTLGIPATVIGLKNNTYEIKLLVKKGLMINLGQYTAEVTEVGENNFTIDLNPPLSRKNLRVFIEVMDIQQAQIK